MSHNRSTLVARVDRQDGVPVYCTLLAPRTLALDPMAIPTPTLSSQRNNKKKGPAFSSCTGVLANQKVVQGRRKDKDRRWRLKRTADGSEH